jgi:hypothetical protein
MQFSQFKNSAEIIKFCRFENKFCCRFRQQNVFKIKLLWMDIRRNSAVMATLSAFLQYEKNWDNWGFLAVSICALCWSFCPVCSSLNILIFF